MQLIFRLKEHTSKCVTDLFDSLEKKLGKELFAMCFPLILTDNGHEFSNIDGMEKSIYGGKRTNIFFCEPNRSDQKGQCENNHKLIRTILPKGTSFSRLTNKDTLLVTNHINSYVRKSLFGKSPFETAMNALPAEFFTKLKLKRINESDVNLTPKLLKH
jgi:transposase